MIRPSLKSSPKSQRKSGLRLLILSSLLLASVAVSLWTYLCESGAAPAEATPVAPPRSTPESSAMAAPEPRLPLGIQPRAYAVPVADVFAPLVTVVQAPPVVEPPKIVEAPKSPPLPFQYVGKMTDALPLPDADIAASGTSQPRITVYLARGNDTFAVSPGEQIDPEYKLVAFQGDTLVFEYLPLSEKKTLSTGNPP